MSVTLSRGDGEGIQNPEHFAESFMDGPFRSSLCQEVPLLSCRLITNENAMLSANGWAMNEATFAVSFLCESIHGDTTGLPGYE